MDFKVNSPTENRVFVETESYRTLLRELEKLKTERGNILHVSGAPGTGKSTNIYHAISELNLDVYEVPCNLESIYAPADKVFESVLNEMKSDFGVERKRDVYRRLSGFDAVLFADRFHDSHEFSDLKGFSRWTMHAGIQTTRFYLKCIMEYLRHRRQFREMNMVFQTAWRVFIAGKKYDIFTDIPLLSGALFFCLSVPFTAVKIDYTSRETLNIIRAHLGDADASEVRAYIDEYGCRPRIIMQKMREGKSC